jgi:hypothetical protein
MRLVVQEVQEVQEVLVQAVLGASLMVLRVPSRRERSERLAKAGAQALAGC